MATPCDNSLNISSVPQDNSKLNMSNNDISSV
jgi:hypothetical protein